jgi:glycosyltransferase involved in cell wall biosynthesis
MALRVLHIGKYYPPHPGGIENFLGDLLPALQRHGIENAAVIHEERRAAQGPQCSPRTGTEHAGPGIYRARSYGQFLYAPISPLFPLVLQRALRQFQPQLLHLHLPNTSAFWVLASLRARRLPWFVQWQADVVLSTHDPRLQLAYPIYRRFERRLLATSRRIIVASPPYLATSRPLQDWWEKCAVIPLGIDVERLCPAQPESARLADRLWGKARFRVLSVGRMTYYKGHEFLIRAAAECEGIAVLIVGGGDRRPRLLSLVAELGLGDRVRVLGERCTGELHALYASCDCFCLPSIERTEAFGLVLLEAMRYGKPIVASEIPGSGVGWVVQDGGTGILVPPGQASNLAAALRRLAGNPGERQRLGEAGARRLREQFEIGRVAGEIAALYHTCVRAE